MLRCCDFYCANLVEGMEGTELLKIVTSGNDAITTTNSKEKKCDDEQFDKAKKKQKKEEGEEEKRKDNKEMENLTSREMSEKSYQPPSSLPLSDNKKKSERENQVVLSCEKPDEGCEKVDGTKEEKEEEAMVKDKAKVNEKEKNVPQSNDVTVRENEGTVDNEDASYSEENSIDNNTFNINNTENSESQEYSELTNDDASSPPPTDCSKSAQKEKDDESAFKENVESEFGTQTEESVDEISALEEEVEEEEVVEDVTEESSESEDGDVISGSEDGDESDDEDDFDNDSLEDGKSKTESTVSSKGPPLKSQANPVPQSSVVSSVKQKDKKTSSPKFKHRPRVRSFGKKDTSEFKIEIFESKRKPPVSISSISTPEDTSRSEIAQGHLNPTCGGKTSDQLVTPDAPSTCSDFTTPDSADNTRSGLIDVSQSIGEERHQSDLLFPVKNAQEEEVVKMNDPNNTLPDLDRKAAASPESKSIVSTAAASKTTTTLVSSSSLDLPSSRPEEKALQPNGLLFSKSSPSLTPNEGNSLITSSHPPPNTQDGERESQEITNSASEIKKPSPMAFTIELGGGGAGQGDTTSKKLDIQASISKWAPKHRRNLSLTKVEEHKKVEERIGKPPVGRPRSGTIGATGLFQGRRAGGYHSEGYFSSDQDDEFPRRTELKSPRSPRTPELRSPHTPQRLVRSSSQDSAKGTSLRKQPGKTEGRTCCKAEKKPTVAEVTGRTKSEKSTKSTVKMTPEARKQSTSANSLSSCQTYDVKQVLVADVGKEENDDVSEAGTYTIEKDSSSPEVEQARNNIDRVFGVSGTESEADMTPRGTVPPEEPWTPTPEPDKFKSPSSLSRSSPNWIQQWAAQVAEHTKSPESSAKVPVASPRGSKPPLASLSSSQESSESRPRRKLPTPPTHHLSFGLTSPRASDLSDHESPTKGKLLRDLYESPSLGQHQNDYGRDTESLLRDTEQLVTSLQARMEMKTGIRGSSFESHDSGGDSDLDTSTSYPINDDDDRIMKTFSSQQKNKLKLSGIDGISKTPPISASPRKPDPLGLDTRLKLGSHFKRERSIVSDSGYDIYSGARGGGEQCLQSDSSSEASEPLKDSRKTIDNNPPLKFNRAFSLRRARLGCDDSPQPKSNIPVEKKKLALSASVGNMPGSRKAPSASKSLQSSSQLQTNTSKNGSNDFSRGDGGRFSLRLARSGSTSAVSKSPSHTSVRKEFSNGIRKGTPRSNSTLSAKEVDFQNWKRRKNYDPMKAAAEGRKKLCEKKGEKNTQGNGQSSSGLRSPSPPGSLLRSASFHGTEGMGVSGRWPRRPNHLNTSEDDGPYSLEEEPQPVPQCSPLRRSPTSPHQLSSPHITSPARQATLAAARARRSSYTHSDEGEGPGSPSRKTSLDESGSEGKRSPMSSSRGAVSSRSKAKMEALDNLVISTIHSLSVKVRTTSETLLQKLKSQYDEEGDRAALLEEVLAHLSESDQTLASGQSRSTSRELAGILRNLKKIEHALEVIDRVMIGIDDDDLDDDDLDGTAVNDWGESDY